jgi:hypothetical protein
MVPGSSLLYLEETAIGPYPELVESSPHHHIHTNIILPSMPRSPK